MPIDLTPREAVIHDALHNEADARGVSIAEFAAVVIARMEMCHSAGMARLDPASDPIPYIGHWGE